MTRRVWPKDDTQAHADDLLARGPPLYAGTHRCAGRSGGRWAGVPCPWTAIRVMGFASEAPNLYVALTHSGVTLAPALSQLAAQEICDRTPADAVLGPYRPQRFAGPDARGSGGGHPPPRRQNPLTHKASPPPPYCVIEKSSP